VNDLPALPDQPLPIIDEADKQIADKYLLGLSKVKIGEQLGIHRDTVAKALKRPAVKLYLAYKADLMVQDFGESISPLVTRVMDLAKSAADHALAQYEGTTVPEIPASTPRLQEVVNMLRDLVEIQQLTRGRPTQITENRGGEPGRKPGGGLRARARELTDGRAPEPEPEEDDE
jgi:hypothetical protein